MTIVPTPSIRTLGCFCACLLLLVSLPATASAQSLESSTPGAIAAGSSASTTPGGPVAQPATTDTRPGPPTEALGLAANPRAVTGGYYSGLLQRALGLSDDFPVKFGGILDLGGNWLASGGLRPNSTSGDFVFGLGFDVDAEKLLRIPGGEFYASGLVYQGTHSNGQTGSVQVYDSLAPESGFHRQGLYELWWRQRLFEDRLILKIGKINAAAEFGQVLNQVPIPEAHMRDWTISDLLYAPAGEMPTNFGKLPSYPNPAWGVTVSLLPTNNFYLSYGLFDGNGARGVQTGQELGPEINSYKFHIGEVGYAWRLGDEGKPGRFAAGMWGQTGTLATGNLTSDKTALETTHGAMGYYAFGSQRLWYQHPGTDPSGLIGFAQLGYSDSPSNIANWYVGSGLTALGLVPGRPYDTTGIGFAWSELNSGEVAGSLFAPNVPPTYTSTSFRSSETMLQTFYQLNLFPQVPVALQAAYTAIPTPGARPGIPWANIFTLRLVVIL